MIDLTKAWCVVWSPRQDAFQVERYLEMIKTNLEIFSNADSGDFIVLNMTESEDEARAFCSRLMNIRDKRLDAKMQAQDALDERTISDAPMH